MGDQIVFNGKTYSSIEEMPEKERTAYLAITRAFQDQNGNAIPDLFEGEAAGLDAEPAKVFINSRMVNNLEELSPQEKAEYLAAMQKLDANGNNIPDFVEDMFRMQAPAAPRSGLISREPNFSTVAPVIGQAPDTETPAVNKRFIILAALMLAALGCSAAVLLFFLGGSVP